MTKLTGTWGQQALAGRPLATHPVAVTADENVLSLSECRKAEHLEFVEGSERCLPYFVPGRQVVGQIDHEVVVQEQPYEVEGSHLPALRGGGLPGESVRRETSHMLAIPDNCWPCWPSVAWNDRQSQ